MHCPDMKATSYQKVFANLGALARRDNDAPGIDEDGNPERYKLTYGADDSGDQTTCEAEFEQGEVTRVQARARGVTSLHSTEAHPFTAELTLEKSATGLLGRELYHNHHGRFERRFAIEGEQLNTLSEIRSSSPCQEPFLPVAPAPVNFQQFQMWAATTELRYGARRRWT